MSDSSCLIAICLTSIILCLNAAAVSEQHCSKVFLHLLDKHIKSFVWVFSNDSFEKESHFFISHSQNFITVIIKKVSNCSERSIQSIEIIAWDWQMSFCNNTDECQAKTIHFEFSSISKIEALIESFSLLWFRCERL